MGGFGGLGCAAGERESVVQPRFRGARSDSFAASSACHFSSSRCKASITFWKSFILSTERASTGRFSLSASPPESSHWVILCRSRRLMSTNTVPSSAFVVEALGTLTVGDPRVPN
jgi:hypothetical protein